jgi:hypothetical protein
MSVHDAEAPDPPEESRRSFPVELVVVTVLVVVVALLVVIGLNFAFLRHWSAVHTGTVNESGPYYGFWSGFGSDLGEATLVSAVFAGVYTGIRRSNCHVKGCWRIGHFPLEHTPYHLCRIHHPGVAGRSEAEILEHHRRRREDYESRHPRAHGSSAGAASERAAADRTPAGGAPVT